jgi:hypothetical protein
VKVCVLALTQRQLAALAPPELKAAATALAANRVYGQSPDDWCPYLDGQNVLAHLREVGFDPISLSGQLGNWTEHADEVIGQVDLFLIDPLFLALSEVPVEFYPRLDATIYTGKRAFCVARHRAIPLEQRGAVDGLCQTKLRSCFRWYRDEGQGEFNAEDLARLSVSLKRVLARFRVDLPNPSQLASVVALFASLGASMPSDRLPTMGASR